MATKASAGASLESLPNQQKTLFSNDLVFSPNPKAVQFALAASACRAWTAAVFQKLRAPGVPRATKLESTRSFL